MRRSRILIIVLATAILGMSAGIAIGYYVVPDSKGRSADCIILARDLQKITYSDSPTGGSEFRRERSIINQYNEECR